AFARRQDMRLEAVDAPAVIREMADLMARSLGPSVDIKTHFPPKLPAVSTDPVQLESAILNLALNARDAMPDGGTITIEGAASSVGGGEVAGLDAGDYVRLSV